MKLVNFSVLTDDQLPTGPRPCTSSTIARPAADAWRERSRASSSREKFGKTASAPLGRRLKLCRTLRAITIPERAAEAPPAMARPPITSEYLRPSSNATPKSVAVGRAEYKAQIP